MCKDFIKLCIKKGWTSKAYRANEYLKGLKIAEYLADKLEAYEKSPELRRKKLLNIMKKYE